VLTRPFAFRSSPARSSALSLIALLAFACRSHPPEAINPLVPDGEPESYSATVVRTVEEGDLTEVIITRVVRSGDMLREEWVEQGGERRAFILRPDLGKRFVLSLDKRTYSEASITGDQGAGPGGSAGIESLADPEEVERAIGPSLAAAISEARQLPDQTVEGRPCQVTEARAVFEDGRTEVFRVFRARDLRGLVIRIEEESEAAGRRVRVITERRDIRTQVAQDEFLVPVDFVRVEGAS
jgi:hypothetical protein